VIGNHCCGLEPNCGAHQPCINLIESSMPSRHNHHTTQHPVAAQTGARQVPPESGQLPAPFHHPNQAVPQPFLALQPVFIEVKAGMFAALQHSISATAGVHFPVPTLQSRLLQTRLPLLKDARYKLPLMAHASRWAVTSHSVFNRSSKHPAAKQHDPAQCSGA